MKIYEFVGGKYHGRQMGELDAHILYEICGSGRSKDWSEEREQGVIVPREELDNELQFDGYIGPMWDGERYLVNGEWEYGFNFSDEEKETAPEAYVLRYETPEVCDALSR